MPAMRSEVQPLVDHAEVAELGEVMSAWSAGSSICPSALLKWARSTPDGKAVMLPCRCFFAS
jgi:hypothetical protein